MVIVIGKDTTRVDLDRALESFSSNKRLNAKKFSGVIKISEDPLELQKKLRDEW